MFTDSNAGGVELQLAYNRGAPVPEMIRKYHSRLIIELLYLQKGRNSNKLVISREKQRSTTVYHEDFTIKDRWHGNFTFLW